MDQLNLQVFSDVVDGDVSVPLETLIVYFIYVYLEDCEVDMHFIKTTNVHSVKSYIIHLIDTKFSVNESNFDHLCQLPTLFVEDNIVISGLCAVARRLIKCLLKKTPDHYGNALLGFKNACLVAPNEVSIWTKFCEIDMTSTVVNTIPEKNTTSVPIPADLARFENHMAQPVRIHNIYKYAREQLIATESIDNRLKNENKRSIQQIDCSIPIEDLNLNHSFAEGPFMTLADVILFPQIYLLFEHIYSSSIERELPLTVKWFKLMRENGHIKQAECILQTVDFQDNLTEFNYLNFPVKIESLYNSDPKRYKPQNRIYTKQVDIEHSLSVVGDMNLDICAPGPPYGQDLSIDWTSVPIEARPIDGALPQKRVARKCEQLENLAKAVLKLAKPNDTIIDFCCGSGHLGILLAALLPKCQIILLENKEISLNRAKERINQLRLTNIKLLQCNLDYFIGRFNVGVSLHACGVATDLVIQKCIERQASFVCCPCCYGGVHNCHHLSYPRSQRFQESPLTQHDYLVLGHAADQTHDKENTKTSQGELCMTIVDTDRMFYALEFNYDVQLGKMIPPSCTPKNHILVGRPKL